MQYLKEYEKWCKEPIFDEETKEELKQISENAEEIKDRFYRELEFGTAGLRGVIGAGTNRMNKYTVTKATQGLANFILKEGTQKKGVVIAYDSRHMSKEFSEYTALCLNANGICTYVFESLRPVPELSFAVRELGCTAGIMITASHNPPKYNGYKVYWEDGAQIVAPKDKQIIQEVRNVQSYNEIKTIDKQQAINNGLYNVIGQEIDNKYYNQLKKQVLNPEVIKQMQRDVKIVYTPLHGTGNIPVKTILKEIGFENVYVVPEQELPNGDFPTVSYPNPEDKNAFTLALELAKQKEADVVLATDPDADRLGVYAKDSKTGEYMPFTGNMSAMVIAEYILSQREQKNTLPNNGAFITTIVSTDMAKAIAKQYKLELMEVLTGFKYIGEKIKQFEQNQDKEYIFGFEESYGCLVGTHARDKDGIVAVMMLCEATAYYKNQGLTLWDQMIQLYEKYGYYKEGLASITMEGADGVEKMQNLLTNIRKNAPTTIGGYKVISIRDYKTGVIKNIETKQESKTDLPESNVVYYDLENDGWCCVRPSGTEPKVKFYIGVKGKSMKEADEKMEDTKKALLEFVEKNK